MATFGDRFPLWVIGDVLGTHSNVKKSYSLVSRQSCLGNGGWVCGLFIFLHKNAMNYTISSVGSLRIPMVQWPILLKIH